MTKNINLPAGIVPYGSSLLENVVMTHEQILENLDEDMLMQLGKLAKQGQTLHEMASHMNVSFAELMMARLHSEDFDRFMEVLETKSASKHLTSARKAITHPESFSAAAYDRVMGALGFTPHIAHVKVHGAASDAAAEKESRAKVGFDTANFIKRHQEGAIIDITPESSIEEPQESTSAEPQESTSADPQESTNNGTSDNGTADNGTADNGTSDNGTSDNGTADNGTADNGTADNGTADNGTADNWKDLM